MLISLSPKDRETRRQGDLKKLIKICALLKMSKETNVTILAHFGVVNLRRLPSVSFDSIDVSSLREIGAVSESHEIS